MKGNLQQEVFTLLVHDDHEAAIQLVKRTEGMSRKEAKESVDDLRASITSIDQVPEPLAKTADLLVENARGRKAKNGLVFSTEIPWGQIKAYVDSHCPFCSARTYRNAVKTWDATIWFCKTCNNRVDTPRLTVVMLRALTGTLFGSWMGKK